MYDAIYSKPKRARSFLKCWYIFVVHNTGYDTARESTFSWIPTAHSPADDQAMPKVRETVVYNLWIPKRCKVDIQYQTM